MTRTDVIEIAGRRIGAGQPTYVIAEMSANHHQDFEQAAAIVRAAAACGADAVKLQTYTPDTITLDCDEPAFRIPDGNTWGGRTLYDLYREAYTPWEWQPRLKAIADELGIHLFSSPFDHSAVDFLERMGVPAYKVASFELVDIPLIQRIARTGKPMILSTGMATIAEIAEAVDTARAAGAKQLALLKCTSAYPAPPEEMNLAAIPALRGTFGVPIGLSDHTRGAAVATAAVALGAALVEKHFTLSRSAGGPDSEFSMEPEEFRALIDQVRVAEKSIGEARFQTTGGEEGNRLFRRSLFATADIKAGEPLTAANVRSIRPALGLPPRHLSEILGRTVTRDVRRGTPLAWDLIAEP
jgi:N-acetylneuraminate synthase